MVMCRSKVPFWQWNPGFNLDKLESRLQTAGPWSPNHFSEAADHSVLQKVVVGRERELNIRHRQNTGHLAIFFKTCRPNTLNCGSDSLGKGDGFKVSCIKSCYLSENCNQNVWRGTSITTRSSSVIPISCGETLAVTVPRVCIHLSVALMEMDEIVRNPLLQSRGDNSTDFLY